MAQGEGSRPPPRAPRRGVWVGDVRRSVVEWRHLGGWGRRSAVHWGPKHTGWRAGQRRYGVRRQLGWRQRARWLGFGRQRFRRNRRNERFVRGSEYRSDAPGCRPQRHLLWHRLAVLRALLSTVRDPGGLRGSVQRTRRNGGVLRR